MESRKKIRQWLGIVSLVMIFSGCIEEPVKEDVPELITKVKLTFTPTNGGAPVEGHASDPDGEGIQDIMTDGPIVLQANQSYALSLSLINELADPTSPEYDITGEVKEEGDEHLFFFGWTHTIFSDPPGDGNIDNRSDELGYTDLDDAGNPIGLNTLWTTSAVLGSATFRVILKHQPGLKSATSSSMEGETDLDLTFDVEVK